MTNYGAIPMSSSHRTPTADLESRSCSNQRIKSFIAAHSRPWKVMFDYHGLGLPHGFSDAVSRIKANFAYFRMNYAIILLTILYLILPLYPVLFLSFFFLMAVWRSLYFNRNETLELIGLQIGDRTVLICLSVLTVVLLVLTLAVTVNIVVTLLVGAVAVLIHTLVRKTDDMFLDEEAAAAADASGQTSSYELISK